MAEEFDVDGIARKEAGLKKRILQAQWFGGQVRFGPEATQVASYNGMRKIDTVIQMRWLSAPVEGKAATAQAIIDGETKDFIIEPEIAQIERTMKRSITTYQKRAEDWALWKWHTARGTPATESNYDLSHPAFKANWATEPGFQMPTFEWEERKKPGPKPKTE